MSDQVLQKALDYADQQKIPLILASTTGKTALRLWEIKESRSIRVIVIAHDPRRMPRGQFFDPEIRKQIREENSEYITDRALGMPSLRITRWLEKTFKISALHPGEKRLEKKYGTGGKVCFLIAERALKRRLIHKGDAVVAVGGKNAGATTALELFIGGNHLHQIQCLGTIASENES